MTSPVSPVSPLNPTFNTSVTQTPSAPATATTQASVPNSTSPANTAMESATTQVGNNASASTNTNTSQRTIKTHTAIGLVLAVEMIEQPRLPTYNLFPTSNISQELPFHVKIHDQILMELLGVSFPTQDGLFSGMQDVIGIEQ